MDWGQGSPLYPAAAAAAAKGAAEALGRSRVFSSVGPDIDIAVEWVWHDSACDAEQVDNRSRVPDGCHFRHRLALERSRFSKNNTKYNNYPYRPAVRIRMYLCMDQPGKVANLSRGQLNRENENFPVSRLRSNGSGYDAFYATQVYQGLRYSAKLSFATGQGGDVCC